MLHFDPDGFRHVPGHGVGLGEVSTLPVAEVETEALERACAAPPAAPPAGPA